MKASSAALITVCLVVGATLVLVSPRAVSQTPNTPAPAGQDGTLEIDGQGVEILCLIDAQGRRKDFVRPGRTVSLPPGTYSLVTVNVQNEFQSSYTATDKDRFTLKPGGVHRIRVGEPLTPSVQVSRCGRTLQLDCTLTDADGRSYVATGSQRTPPHFTIYSGDKEVGSGDLQYG